MQFPKPCPCPLPRLIMSNHVRTETGIVRACWVCEYCGRWQSWRWEPYTASGEPVRAMLEGQGSYPKRPPSCFTFPVRVPWRDIRRRNEERAVNSGGDE